MNSSARNRNQFIFIFFAFAFGMILSNLIGQARHDDAGSGKNRDVLITLRGIDFYLEDLPEPLAQRYQDIEADAAKQQSALLHSFALEQYVSDYAIEKRISFEQAADKLFALVPIDDAMVNDYYQRHAKTIDKPFYQVEGDIRKQLQQMAARKARFEKLQQLAAKGDMILYPDSPHKQSPQLSFQ